MYESSKFDFDTYIKSHQPKEEEKRQYLNDWLHLHLSQESCHVSLQNLTMNQTQTTRTTHAIVSILLPETSKMSGPLNRNSSSIVFWSLISSQNTQEINLKETEDAITSNYKSHFPRIGLNMSIDLKPDITKFLKDINKNKDINKRTIVHLISDLSPEFNSPQKKADQFRSLREIIKSTYQCGLHIIDCDQAGIFYPYYQEILKETEYTMQHKDLFVFFSCLENQKVPKLPGLPNDLFTSFLISPAKTALLFHSCHYFGFNHTLNFNDYSIFNTHSNSSSNSEISAQPPKQGQNHSQFFFKSSLSPLTIDQINSAPIPLFENLMSTMRHIVEAMLCESDHFCTFFRMDETVADIFVGFVIAQHFFTSLHITPISYPSIPVTVTNHPLWSTVDLRLDAALMTLTYNSSENLTNPFNLYNFESIPFCAQELQTIKLLIEADSPISEFSGHITFLPDCLKNGATRNEALFTLALFIENEGIEGLELAKKFPIFPTLVELAKDSVKHRDKSFDTHLLLCMSKMYFFYPRASEIVPFFSNQYLSSFTVYHLRSDSPLSSLVLFTMVMKTSDPSKIALFLKSNWLSITECLIQSGSEKVRVWALFLVSSFSQCIVHIEQILQLLDAISSVVDDSSPAVRVAFLVALQSIPRLKCPEIERTVVELGYRLISDVNPAVRREVATLLVSMKGIHKATSFDNKPPRADQMTASTSMSTSDFFSESGSDSNLESTAKSLSNSNLKSFEGEDDRNKKARASITSFSFSNKSDISRLISTGDQSGGLIEKDLNGANSKTQELVLNGIKLLSADPFRPVRHATVMKEEDPHRNFTIMQFFKHYITTKVLDVSFDPNVSLSSCCISSSSNNNDAYSSSSLALLLSDSENSQKSDTISRVSLSPEMKRAKLDGSISTAHINVVAGNSSAAPTVSSAAPTVSSAVSQASSTVKFPSSQRITSNFAVDGFDDEVIFGTDNGYVFSYKPSQQTSALNSLNNVVDNLKAATAITHLRYEQNNGFPLLLLATTSGDFAAGHVSTASRQQHHKSFTNLTSFRIFCDHSKSGANDGKHPSLCEFEYDSNDAALFCYSPCQNRHVQIFDLDKEQKLGEIECKNDHITDVHVPNYLSKSAFICNEELYLYDYRYSIEKAVLTYDLNEDFSGGKKKNKVFKCRTFNNGYNYYQICMCSENGFVTFNDLRMIGYSGFSRNSFDAKKIEALNGSEIETLCLDVNNDSLASAVGTTCGGYVLLYPGDRKVALPNKSRQTHRILQVKWISNNNRPGLIAMHNYTDIQSYTFT